MSTDHAILLCYDGSEGAQAATERAALLFPGASFTVLAVWEPIIDLVMQAGFGAGYPPPITNAEEIDATIREQATTTARDGADRARSAGLEPEPRAEMRRASVSETILAVADEIDADAIVVGTRGLGGVKSLLLGSVSHGVVQHADRPVVVIPSEAVASERASRRDPSA